MGNALHKTLSHQSILVSCSISSFTDIINETRVDEEDADNAIIPYSPSESILVLFVVSTGNFGDFVGGIPGTNHSAIGHVIQCNTSYMNY